MSNEVKSGILEKKGQQYFPVTHVSLVQGLQGELSDKQDIISDLDTIRQGSGLGATAVQPEDVPNINNLLNYYTKSEIAQKISDSLTEAFVFVNALPEHPTAANLGKIYLVPSDVPDENNLRNEFIAEERDGSYYWEQIGSASITLSWEAGVGENSVQQKDTGVKAIGLNSVAEGYGEIQKSDELSDGFKLIWESGANYSIVDVGQDSYLFRVGQVLSKNSDGSDYRVIKSIGDGYITLDEAFSTFGPEMEFVYIITGVALGNRSHLEGNGCFTGDNSAHAEGTGSSAAGPYSHAEGLETEASGSRSHAEGYGSKATNRSSHAEGHKTVASGERSHSEGQSTVASGKQSHAEGYNTKATANQSHAEGYESTASGNASHSEGHNTIASGKDAHAEGVRESYTYTTREWFYDRIKSATIESTLYQTLEYSTALERYEKDYKLWYLALDDTFAVFDDSSIGENQPRWESHSGELTSWINLYDQNITVKDVYTGTSKWFKLSQKLNIGNKTTVQVIFLISEEEHTELPNIGAKGEGSHVEGVSTNALNKGEHAEGKYNVSNNNTIHSIGIGTSNDDRKNAFEIMQNGNAYLYGIGGYNGTNPSNAESLQNFITNKSDVFVIEDGITTYGELMDAMEARKILQLYIGRTPFVYSGFFDMDSIHYFVNFTNNDLTIVSFTETHFPPDQIIDTILDSDGYNPTWNIYHYEDFFNKLVTINIAPLSEIDALFSEGSGSSSDSV